MKAWSFGSFFSSFAIPANLQKRLVSFLLQRAIGHFLEDSLDVEKLDIELSNGIVHLTDLKLNSKALNDLAAGSPLAVTTGSIRSITATIPLRNLWNGQCVLEIDGIDITLAPVQAQPELAQDLEEQLLSSSVNLANEFLKQRGDGRQEEELGQSILQSMHTPTGFPGDFNYRPASAATASPTNNPQQGGPGAWGNDSAESSSELATEGEGIQLVAKLIEKLLARIQVICKGTTLRLRHSSNLPLTCDQARKDFLTTSSITGKDEPKMRDYELVVQLPYIAYRDETPGWAPTDNVEGSMSGTSSISSSSSALLEESTTIPSVIWQDAPESIKTVVFRGFSIWIKERDSSTNTTASPSHSPSSAQSTETPHAQQSQSQYPLSNDGARVDESVHDSDNSDSDDDVFMDAQDTFSRSAASSQYVSRSTILSASSRLDQSRFLQRTDSTASSTRSSLYEAQIISCLQHRNRVKVSVRKNAALTKGAVAQAVVRSLVDMDVQIKSLFVALSPNQVGFLLEILLAIEAAPSPPESSSNRSSGASKTGVPSRETLSSFNQAQTWGTQQQGRPNKSDATLASARSHLRSDDYLDNRMPMESQHSSSPRSQSPMTGILSPSQKLDRDDMRDDPRLYRDPSGRAEPDQHIRAGRHDSSSSSRVLSDSTYPGRSTLLPPSALSSNNASSLSVKIKARLPTFQIYILLQDPQSLHDIPTDSNFFCNPRPEALRCNHLKIELDNLVLRYQQWRLPINTGSTLEGRTKFTKKSQIDFTLNKFLIAEWIEKQSPALLGNDPTRPLREFQQRAYRTLPLKQYIPIVEFDPELEPLTPGQESKFCTLAIPSRYMSERASTLRSKSERRKQERARMDGGPHHPAASLADLRGISSSRQQRSGESSTSTSGTGARADSPINHSATKEVIRMRVLLGGKKDAAPTEAGYAQDVTVEVKPFQIHIDLSTLQRMELLLQRFMIYSQSQQPLEKADTSSRLPAQSYPEKIPEDFDRPQQQVMKQRTRFRLRLNTVRVWLSVPDMAATLAGAKDTGPGGRSIYDMLALDISKLVVTKSSDMSRAATSPASQGASALKVEFSNFSAFIIEEHALQAKAILTVTSLPAATSNISGCNSVLPNLEITSKPVESIMAFVASMDDEQLKMSSPPNAFIIPEGEENVQNVVNERSDLLRFKHITLETSKIAVNCQLPLVAAQLEKEAFDTLQLRANDLQTWLVLFTDKLAADVEALMPPVSPSADAKVELSSLANDFNASGFYSTYRGTDAGTSYDDGQDRDDLSEHGTDRSTAYGEELRLRAADDIHYETPLRSQLLRNSRARPRRSVLPTLASIVISIQTVDVLLHYPTSPTVLDPIPTVKSYQLNATEASVFAGVKFQGGTDTYLSLDAESLGLWEVTAQKPKVALLASTLSTNSKIKGSKPMFFMTSILSMDTEANYKESNINLMFSGISWKFSIEQTAVDDVQDFFTEPKGIVYWNLPQQCTRVNVSLVECCMDYKPLNIPARFVLSFDRMKVAATLRLESPTLISNIQIYNMSLFLLDNVEYLQNRQHLGDSTQRTKFDSVKYWTSLGFAHIGQCPYFELVSVKSRNGQLPLYDLTITNQIFYLDTCSDSLQALMTFASYMGENGDLPREKKQILERLAEAERAANRAKSNVIYQDVLASLDEEAFKHKPIATEDRGKSTNARHMGRQGSGAVEPEDQLEVVEEFYAVERDDTDHEMIRVQESPDMDGFHEVYADPRSKGKARQTSTVGKASSSKSDTSAEPSKPSRSPPSPQPHKPSPLPLTSTGSVQPSIDPHITISPTRDYFGGKMERTLSSASSKSRSKSLGQVEEGIVRLLDPEFKAFHIVENFYSVPLLTEEEKKRDDNSVTKVRIRVRNFNVYWRLFDGLDFESSRLEESDKRRHTWHMPTSGRYSDDPQSATMPGDHPSSGDNVFDRLSREYGHHKSHSPASSEADTIMDYQSDTMSQTSKQPSRASTTSSRRPSNLSSHGTSRSSGRRSSIKAGRSSLGRSSQSMIEIRAESIRLDFEDYISGIERALSLSLRVKEFEILDNLQTSLWHKFLSSQRPDSHKATPRLTQSSMIRLDLVGVRPVLAASTVEYRVKVRVLPLRLYIDQDALMFLIRFFAQSAGDASATSAPQDLSERGAIGEMVTPPAAPERKKPSDLYFQSISVGTIALKMDYKPKHVDYTGLSGGNLVELMNFFHLEGAEMTLQEVRLRGISGIPKIGQELINLWLPYIRSTQVPHMVSGLTPIRSLVNVGSGIADLVLLPIEQYKKDGHLIKGLQKGGKAFTRATTLEALKIGTKLAVGTQVLLEHADDIFGSSRLAGASSSGGGRHGSGSEDQFSQSSSEGYDAHGRRLVATMVSDHEAYMEESFESEGQLFARWSQDHQSSGGSQYDVDDSSHRSSPSPGGSANTSGGGGQRVSKYANQPADVNEGMELAYKSLSKNFGAAAHTIFAVPMEVYERAGAQGSVRAVIRAVPVAVLKPMIGATEAFSKVLIGLRNSIDPVQRLQMEDKYKRP
ncbi:autophagy- protein 2 [Actinomortierella wolfii]|nr:autophagy- protein 2 [Actinomortierella wolfii]